MHRVAATLLAVGFLASGAVGARPVASSAAQPDWSPDGRWIVFERDRNPGDFENRTDLAVVRVDGKASRTLVRGEQLPAGEPRDPSWSPDGAQVAFWDCCDPDEVYVVRADGTGLRRLAIGRLPRWSPNGNRIAFVGERLSLSVIDADGTNLRRFPTDATDLDWRSDESGIAFERDGDLFHLDLASGALQQLTTTREREAHPRWSPDGTTLAFARRYRWMVRDRAGRERALASYTPFDETSKQTAPPALWSPDGRRLVLPRFRLHVIDADGTDLRPVTPKSNAQASEPAWSPDGRRLAFIMLSLCHGEASVGVTTIPTLRVRPLTNKCTVVGTPRGDRLRGSRGNDYILGYGGSDRVWAGLGDDVVRGGAGGDWIDGGGHENDICDTVCDALYGERGNDVLIGRRAPSLLGGGRGRDLIRGGSEGDLINGGPGLDRIRAGGGADSITARDGSIDHVVCGTGDDAVTADRFDVVARDCNSVSRR